MENVLMWFEGFYKVFTNLNEQKLLINKPIQIKTNIFYPMNKITFINKNNK